MNKIVIITGGNKGLGKGLSKVYHKSGFRVFSISRTLKERFYFAEQFSCDLSKTEKIDSTLNKIFDQIDLEKYSEIILINNAGDLGNVNTTEKLLASDINYTLSVNLAAPIALSGAFIKLTKNFNGIKKIINISSGAAIHPYESWTLYCSTKAGLDMMTKVIAKEQKNLSNGVKINAIYPGIVDTNMQTKARNTPKEQFKAVDRFIEFFETGALSSPKEAASQIYKIDQSNKLTNGQIVDVRNS
ncbi:MAG: SDR family NAD(P)-dependent oxidoreductase [Lutibacter sp.]